MARPRDPQNRQCVYCLKYPLYGDMRNVAMNEVAWKPVVCCKKCKKARQYMKHEEMLEHSLDRVRSQLWEAERHLTALAENITEYSPAFCLRYGGAKVREAVRAMQAAEEAGEGSPGKSLLDKWDRDFEVSSYSTIKPPRMTELVPAEEYDEPMIVDYDYGPDEFDEDDDT